MRKPRPVGLIAAGRIAKPYLSLLTSLAGRLGPVKSLAPRVASRMVNRLRAGYPIASYEELGPAGLVVVCIEDRQTLVQTVAEMAPGAVEWRHRSVIVCHRVVESVELTPLTGRGARVASLWMPEEGGWSEYLAEGDRQAIREFRQLLGAPKQRIRVLKQGGKLLYLAGLAFSTSLITPLAGGAIECFRAAGLSPPVADATLELAILRTLRAYRKAGKKGWLGPLADEVNNNVRGQLEALRTRDPALANYFRSIAILAHQRLGKPAGWLELAPARKGRRS